METINERWKRAISLLNDGPWGKRGSGGGSGGSGGGNGDGSGGGGNGGGPKNPWNLPPGGKGPRKPAGPAALDQLYEQMKGRMGGGGGGFPGGANQVKLIRNVLIGLAVLWLVFTSFHRIGPQEEGVIMRLGKYAGTLSPGIGLTLPAPIDRVTKVDVQAIETIDIPSGSGENLILTGDQNIINLAYSVRWDVQDPENFLFQLGKPQETIREVAESAMREVVGTVTLTDALGPGRSDIERRVAQRAQSILGTDYKAGVRIRGIAIKQADPPEAVNDAFKEVTVAQQNRQANINNANAYAQQTLSRAQGEAAAFDKVFEQYRLAPDVTRRRMYYETMEAVLSRMDKTIVEPNSVAPYLPLSQAKPRVTVEEAPR